LDLRDFPQPKVEVEDEEALDFLTGLIDPSPKRKERSRKLVPEMWSSLSNGDCFEVGLTFAGMFNVDHWDKQLQTVRRRPKAGDGWDWLTPRLLAVGGRALMGGQRGFEELGDILRREAEDKPRQRKYGKWAEIGPLSIIDPSLCDAARKLLGRATEAYVAARRNPDMQPLNSLAKKYGIYARGLKSLADSGLLPTWKVETVKRGPVLMSAAALQPLILEMGASISGMRAAPKIGVHQMHLDDLRKRGLLTRVEGPVLKLLKSDAYYTRASVNALMQNIAKNVKRRAPPDCVRLRVALRACNIRSVPWAGIVQAVLDGRLEVFGIRSDKSRRALADRLAVRDAGHLSSLIAQELAGKPIEIPEWIGNAAASEILGVNETVIWRLVKVGALEKHREAPLYVPFKRSEVERLNAQMIFTAEIVRNGRFSTYREASAWLRQQGVAPRFELKTGGWKVYARAEVETKLARRIDAMPPKPAPPPRPTGPRYAPDSTLGKLAAARESSDASRVGRATAARILGSTIYSVQKLAAKGHLTASHKVTPFDRTEVEALAKRIVFVPEIMRLSGYISHIGVMNWLKNAGIEPLFWLEIGRIPAFDRDAVEAHFARPEFIRGEHPRLVKRKLLDMVERGSSVHQASIACGVSYATAKRWAKSDAAPDVRSARGEHPRFVRRKLLDMVVGGSSVRQASIACGVNYGTAQRWKRRPSARY
jgi:transposase-like protein